MTTDTKKPAEPKVPSPPVLVYGPAGSGKTALIDLMVKFFESDRVEDGYTLPKDGKECRWTALKPGGLYITNEAFTEADVMHAGLGHGVFVISIFDVLKDLGAARGRTMVELTTERFITSMLKDALGMGGPRRGGGAPRN